MPNVRILLAGTPSTAVEVATQLHTAGYGIVGALCPFPKPVGRKKILTPSELEQWMRANNLPVLHVNHEYFEIDQSDELIAQFGQIDLLVCADFGYLIPGWLLRLPKHGSLNLHPSLLPRWRGATPVPFTLLFGDTKTGISIIQMNEKFDLGGVVVQEEVRVQETDTTPVLLDRCFQVGAKLLVKILPAYLGQTLKSKPQPAISPTPHTRKFSREDGFIPIEVLNDLMETGSTDGKIQLLQEYGLPTTVDTVVNMVRALTPWPGVWTTLDTGKRMKVLETASIENMLTIKTVQHEGKGESKLLP